MGYSAVGSGNGVSPSHERGEVSRYSEKLPHPYVVRPAIVDRALSVMGALSEVHPVVAPYTPQESVQTYQVASIETAPVVPTSQAPESLFTVDSQHDQGAGVVGADPIVAPAPQSSNPITAEVDDNLTAIRNRVNAQYN